MKIFCTSVLPASASVSVQNVSFMVELRFILGKHKDHEVKTIKKSHPIIKSELESTLDRI
jgi:hypothetical protein